mgnify:FL=1
MNRLAQILPKENVMISVRAGSKKRVFEQASLLFESRCQIARSKIFNALFSREKLGSTGLGNGIAIPHGRLEGLEKSIAVVLCLDIPIPFDASDGKAVDLLIFLLVPTNASKDHLETLAEVANMLSDSKFINELRHSATVDQLHDGICSWMQTDSKVAD